MCKEQNRSADIENELAAKSRATTRFSLDVDEKTWTLLQFSANRRSIMDVNQYTKRAGGMIMKLAAALQERADINSRLSKLYPRLSNNAIVQEGEKPAEDPQSLIDEIESCTARLAELIARINLTNCSIRVDGKTLTEMIAEKDALNAKINLYRSLIGAASNVAHRATKTEIKIKSTVDVGKLQKQADAYAKELRLLDNRLQEANWLNELL